VLHFVSEELSYMIEKQTLKAPKISAQSATEKLYEKPTLRREGDLRDITLGISGGSGEGTSPNLLGTGSAVNEFDQSGEGSGFNATEPGGSSSSGEADPGGSDQGSGGEGSGFSTP
jgi:hypothetical protein